MTTSFKSKVHPTIVEYFQSDEVALWESFKPGRGWLREAPRLSLTRIAQLRKDGIDMIAVKHIPSGRIADFSIRELI